uniref:Alkaline phosphatase n=1 Tax=Holotrichia parallela TaxID=93412 RepID=A0A3G1LC34_HOLPA|nr:Cry8Ea3 toxin-binding alkaline phosphatase [Holotrichia parallela]
MNAKCVLVLISVIGLVVTIQARPENFANSYDDGHMHPNPVKRSINTKTSKINAEEYNSKFWIDQAQKVLNAKLLEKPNTNIAKNVIMFLGDGLSIPTIKASRLYLGQLHNESGEETILSFEKFPYVGLSKTYCVDTQVPDSACTATAYLSGVKNNYHTIGVTAAVQYQDCDASLNEENHVYSIAQWSQLKNKKTGIVTTTRITHASPAGAYANTADRDFESDADTPDSKCKDIAHQLVYSEVGKNLNVVLGGGRREFLPNTVTDEGGQRGRRLDGENLIEAWLKSKQGHKAQYVWNRTELENVAGDTEYLLGLFEDNHCKYHLDAEDNDPSLTEMTEKAIELLASAENGYFLFVEGGRIDHAHHETRAQKALDETVEFHKAIERAVELTNKEDTLIVVTADHAHTMSVSGYAERGNDILGICDKADDELPYMTLSYANGPGYRASVGGRRTDVTNDNTHDKNYRFPVIAPLEDETHGGDDVSIYSQGPWSHLLTGVIEQNVIPHIMAYASCVGDGLKICDQELERIKKSNDGRN